MPTVKEPALAAGERKRRKSTLVHRIAAVLELLAQSPAGSGVSELSRALRLPKSAVHRILSSMSQEGLVALDDETHLYRLGPAALRIGMGGLAHNNIRHLAQARLRELRDATGETATLTLLAGRERIYAEQVESFHQVRQVVALGVPEPLCLGSNGKVILAYLERGLAAPVLRDADGLRRPDGRELTCDELLADLAEIRRNGYSISIEERVVGGTSVSAPIFNDAGQVIGCLGIAGVVSRQSRDALRALGPVVRHQAELLSRQLGWNAARVDQIEQDAPTEVAS